EVRDEAATTGRAARGFASFDWITKDSWTRRRRVVAKAEWRHGNRYHRWECPEVCVSGLAHGFSDTQAAKRSPNIMANWLRAANHSRTFRPSFSKLRIAR
ncbi:hypothetical protein CFR71_15830, partial [Novacetimonas pomaceti]